MADVISIIDSQGVERFMGNLEQPAGLVKAWPVYGDTAEAPMVLRSEWKAHCREPFLGNPFLPPVADQDGIGECNASATCTAMEYTRNRQGLDYKQLSAGFLYGKINGGSDRGSLLEDGLSESMNGGVCTVEQVGYLDWRKRGAAAIAEAKGFRVLEAFICPTFDHCMSAVINGFALISGVSWYSNYTPGADGWLPSGRGSAGGHAIFGFEPCCRVNEYGIEHQNSWSPGWGRKGRFVMGEGAYGRQIGGWWAVRSVVDEGGIVPPLAA